MPTRFNLRSRNARYLVLSSLVASVLVVFEPGCGDTLNTYNSYYYGAEAGQVGEPTTAGGAEPVAQEAGGNGGDGGDGVDDGHGKYPDAPYADTTVAEQQLDVFGGGANHYWFGVSDEQLAFMNESVNGGGPIGGGPIGGGPLNGDIYAPGGQSATFVDHLWITTAGKPGQTADYGKVKVKLVGQSTLRAWNRRSIPNFNIDSNEFVPGQRIGGFEHLRFNNAQVGSIFREWLTLALYRQLDYPAPLATFAWVSSNVWGGEVSIPYVQVQRYKRAFCKGLKAYGGDCANMWEFVGDFGGQDPGGPKPGPGPLPQPSVFDTASNCQFDKCENTRVKQLEQLLIDTPDGDGFKAATSEMLDWPAFHQFQCLSWVLATGDDTLHNGNNVVLVEGKDGKFRYLPYSVDISLGQEWYPSVTLGGQNRLARGCQSDKACWADTIAACEGVVKRFTQANPVAMLDRLYDSLTAEGMLRDGDEARYDALRLWFKDRLKALPVELEANRAGPALCPDGQVDCGGYCDFPEACGPICKPPVGKPPLAVIEGQGGAGAPGDVGAPNGGAPAGVGECPLIAKYAL